MTLKILDLGRNKYNGLPTTLWHARKVGCHTFTQPIYTTQSRQLLGWVPMSATCTGVFQKNCKFDTLCWFLSWMALNQVVSWWGHLTRCQIVSHLFTCRALGTHPSDIPDCHRISGFLTHARLHAHIRTNALAWFYYSPAPLTGQIKTFSHICH